MQVHIVPEELPQQYNLISRNLVSKKKKKENDLEKRETTCRARRKKELSVRER